MQFELNRIQTYALLRIFQMSFFLLHCSIFVLGFSSPRFNLFLASDSENCHLRYLSTNGRSGWTLACFRPLVCSLSLCLISALGACGPSVSRAQLLSAFAWCAIFCGADSPPHTQCLVSCPLSYWIMLGGMGGIIILSELFRVFSLWRLEWALRE